MKRILVAAAIAMNATTASAEPILELVRTLSQAYRQSDACEWEGLRGAALSQGDALGDILGSELVGVPIATLIGRTELDSTFNCDHFLRLDISERLLLTGAQIHNMID